MSGPRDRRGGGTNPHMLGSCTGQSARKGHKFAGIEAVSIGLDAARSRGDRAVPAQYPGTAERMRSV